ncbi:MAG: ribosome biogenesis GTP-binding protein YihA/YsxC [Myxococcota bacterium]|jgi:GTP-binding protein|nr:ribosome biogenesis GTP-binding protein YihA/YsxC [Myxococcota bacterium]
MKARFVLSASSPKELPDLGLPEIAFLGRSNVGKSSVIGSLLKQSSLVRTSRQPGRTRLLNLFVFEERFAFVDLPGYGYAKASKSIRAELTKMIGSYLANREVLSVLVLILDARREEVSELDKRVMEYLYESGVPIVALLNKIDLVQKNKRLQRITKIAQAFGLPRETFLTYSAKKGEGRHELVKHLDGMLVE